MVTTLSQDDGGRGSEMTTLSLDAHLFPIDVEILLMELDCNIRMAGCCLSPGHLP